LTFNFFQIEQGVLSVSGFALENATVDMIQTGEEIFKDIGFLRIVNQSRTFEDLMIFLMTTRTN